MSLLTGCSAKTTAFQPLFRSALSLFAACLILLAARLVRSASAKTAIPLSHRLEVKITPQEHLLVGQDILRVRIEGQELSFELHVGLKVEILHVQGVDLTKALKEKERGAHRVVYTLPFPAGLRGREVEIRFDYAGQIFDPVQKSPTLTFVAGDLTSGLIGEEGIFLPAGGSWYPQLTGSLGRLSTFDLQAKIAEPWRLVSQGDLVSQEIKGGIVTAHFSSPIPTDGLAITGGKYVVHSRVVDGITLSTYFFPEESSLSDLFLEKAAEYLRTFSALLIPYPYKKFDIVENFFTTGYGMPTYTLLGRDVVKRGRSALQPGYLDHEIVHSWWGNYVYYEGAWGNWCEGLTTYYANYYTKERQNPQEAWLHRMGSSQKYSIRVDPAKDYPLRKFAGKEEGFEDDIGYSKASMVFHLLRRMSGDDLFFQTMRQILRDYGGKIARWEDFQQAFERALGRDLGWFFRQWLDRTGLPQLSLSGVSSEAKGSGRYRVTGQIRQRGEPYRLSVPLVLQAAGERRELTVEAQGELTPFEIEVGSPPQKLSLDPDYHLMRRLAPSEIPPCLQATLREKEKLLVYPSRGSKEAMEIYKTLAERASQTEGGKALPDDQVSEELLRSHSLFLVGGPGENRVTERVLEELRTRKVSAPRADGADFVSGPSAFSLNGKEYTAPSDSLLVSFRHPWDPGRFVTLYYGLSPKALERAQYLFFYGWYGFVAFQEGRPAQRGYFPILASETIHVFSRDNLQSPSGAYSTKWLIIAELLRAHVDFLASEALGGRYPGTPGDKIASDYIARLMARSGLVPYVETFSRETRNPPPSGTGEGYLQPFSLQVSDAEVEKSSLRLQSRGQGAQAAALLDLIRKGVETYNIIGYLEGSDPRLKEEIVILGAHYDHLGRNEAGEVFRGAVDNASGVAVLLEVARVLASSHTPRAKRSLLFIAFGGEEWGLRGSRHFVATLPQQAKIRAMINLDSLGSGNPEEFSLLGESYFPELRALAIKHAQPLGLKLGKNIDAHGFKQGSDHYPFYEKGWVAVDLFAADYRALHQVTDRPESVNVGQLDRLGKMVLGMVRELAE